MSEITKQVAIERSIIKKYKKPIWNRFVAACKDYQLVNEGDKIAVCISGGKDSFLLAKCMQNLQRYSDVPFEVEFLCMDPGYRQENREKILRNAKILGIELKMFDTDIFDTVFKMEKSACYLCARMRRGYLYKNAQLLGCNKIALGHHFNDVVETSLMSMIWGAELKTMMPKLKSKNFEGMELIRPLYYVREEDILAWRRYNELDFIMCACRFTEQPVEKSGARAATKQLVKHICTLNPQADYNIFHSLHHVNLNMMLGWTKQGQYETFLDGYDLQDAIEDE